MCSTTICLLIIILLLIIVGLYYLSNSNIKETIYATIITKPPTSPKEELVQYFAMNWTQLAPVFLNPSNCEGDPYIPPEIMNDFKGRFGHYFKNTAEDMDPMLKHYSNGTYERNFKMEVKEICKTLRAMGEFINTPRYPARQLKELAVEIERLHNEHFPQAVFISVILDHMLKMCNTYPEYTIDQVVNTHDLLTTSVIFYLSKPNNTQ
jgi:hypothetical protein